MRGLCGLPSDTFCDGARRLVIESTSVGDDVVVSLVLWRLAGRTGRVRRSDRWERVRTLASDRFHWRDLVGYSDFGGQLRVIARHVLNGEFGCFVHFTRREDLVAVELWERRLRDRRVATELRDGREFDPRDDQALVIALEYAEELRHRAGELNAAADIDEATARLGADDHRDLATAREHDVQELISLLELADSA